MTAEERYFSSKSREDQLTYIITQIDLAKAFDNEFVFIHLDPYSYSEPWILNELHKDGYITARITGYYNRMNIYKVRW